MVREGRGESRGVWGSGGGVGKGKAAVLKMSRVTPLIRQSRGGDIRGNVLLKRGLLPVDLMTLVKLDNIV